jgi:hypothetical protein
MWQSLKILWAVWKRVAHRVGNFQARVLLTLIYAVFVPFGLMVRCFSDPLNTKKRPTSWLDHPQETTDLDWARHQG